MTLGAHVRSEPLHEAILLWLCVYIPQLFGKKKVLNISKDRRIASLNISLEIIFLEHLKHLNASSFPSTCGPMPGFCGPRPLQGTLEPTNYGFELVLPACTCSCTFWPQLIEVFRCRCPNILFSCVPTIEKPWIRHCARLTGLYSKSSRHLRNPNILPKYRIKLYRLSFIYGAATFLQSDHFIEPYSF